MLPSPLERIPCDTDRRCPAVKGCHQPLNQLHFYFICATVTYIVYLHLHIFYLFAKNFLIFFETFGFFLSEHFAKVAEGMPRARREQCREPALPTVAAERHTSRRGPSKRLPKHTSVRRETPDYKNVGRRYFPPRGGFNPPPNRGRRVRSGSPGLLRTSKSFQSQIRYQFVLELERLSSPS